MTLIEVLLTLSILSFGVLALAGLQHQTYVTNDLAGQRSMAVGFAHEKMVSLLMTLLSSSESIAYSGAETLGPPSSGNMIELPELSMEFERTWAIIPDSNGRQASIKVTVSWSGSQGNRHIISLDSVIMLPPV